MLATKRLTLVRHARAEPAFADAKDWDRLLDRRGHADAEEMGRRLQQRKLKPTLLITSPARRALKTAQIIATQMRYPVDRLREVERLYHAGPADLLKVIHEMAASETHLMLVGHNPGISEFADKLSPERSIEMIPTCGVVTAEFPIADWSELQFGTALAVEFDYPGAT